MILDAYGMVKARGRPNSTGALLEGKDVQYLQHKITISKHKMAEATKFLSFLQLNG